MAKRNFLLIALVLAAITAAVYWQVGSHEFLNYDDDQYVTNNARLAGGLTGETLRWAFASLENFNWHPLTWISHALDVQLFGMNPRGHHLMNVGYHVAATIVLFASLVCLTAGLWQSAFVAAMFALHPLHVESVAWVAERKDVLSGLFWFLVMLFYSRYVRRQQSGSGSVADYILVLGVFVAGLMAKPMLVTLPVILLLLDFWPLQRFTFAGGDQTIWKLFREKLPFFLCSAGVSLITMYAQKIGGSVMSLTAIPMQLRLQNAVVSLLGYLEKTVYPHNLAVLYPFSKEISAVRTAIAVLLIILITGGCIKAAARRPYLLVGWLWFLVSLLPVIGIIQVGEQAMADRYMYIPATGLFIMAAWGGSELRERLSAKPGWWQRMMVPAVAVVLLAVCLLITRNQLRHWRSNLTLYNHTLSITRGNFIIHYNIAMTYRRMKLYGAAMQHFEQGLAIIPNDADMRTMYAATLADIGNKEAAVKHLRMVLAEYPRHEAAKIYLQRFLSLN